MAEVTAIVNARPLVPFPTDPDMLEVVTPSTLLTQKSTSLKAAPGNFSQTVLYSRQWRRLQYDLRFFGLIGEKSIYCCFDRGGSGNLKLEIWRKVVLLRSKELPRISWPLVVSPQSTSVEMEKCARLALRWHHKKLHNTSHWSLFIFKAFQTSFGIPF